MNIHMEKTFKAIQCQKGRGRNDKRNKWKKKKKKKNMKKAPDFFVSCLEISIFQTPFTKSKS